MFEEEFHSNALVLKLENSTSAPSVHLGLSRKGGTVVLPDHLWAKIVTKMWLKRKENKTCITILNSLILVPDSVPGQMMHATVKDLNPWVDYEFRVVAINSVGVGEPSTHTKQIRTKAAGTL